MYSRNGLCLSTAYSRNCRKAIAIATNAPVTLAVRVPPSAWMTSQSMITVRSPRALMSTAARMERPIRRWISCVRPEGRPLVTSRGVRLAVARGSIEYSAVTQPFPLLRRNGGTVSSTVAAHKTCVFPTLINAEPSAVMRQPVVICTGRNWSAVRLSVRITFHHQVEKYHHAHHDQQDEDDAAGRALRARSGFGIRPHRPELCHNPDGSIVTDDAPRNDPGLRALPLLVPARAGSHARSFHGHGRRLASHLPPRTPDLIVTDDAPRNDPGLRALPLLVPARAGSHARSFHGHGRRLASHLPPRTPAVSGARFHAARRHRTHPRGVVRGSRQTRRACLPVDLARRGSGRGAALEAGSRHGLLLQRPLLRPRPVADRGPQSASGIRHHARETVPRQAVIERPLSPPFPSAPPRLRVKVHPSNSREPPPDSNYNGRTPCLLPPSPRPPLR